MTIKDIIGKEIAVKCETEKEYKCFLQTAEAEGILWESGDIPTKHYNYWHGYPEYLSCSRGKHKMNHVNIANLGHKVVLFKELNLFIESNILEIKCKSRKVIAILKDKNGNYIKHSKAICSPEDEFDFEVGKKIALQRLFGIESENNKPISKHKLQMIGVSDISYGIIGENTEVEAYGNIKLCVGDVVELFDNDGESLGLHYVCKNSSYSKGFVMGVSSLKFKNGKSSEGWLIIKRKSYNKMKIGDVVDSIKYVSD